jgi:hypothetical protein
MHGWPSQYILRAARVEHAELPASASALALATALTHCTRLMCGGDCRYNDASLPVANVGTPATTRCGVGRRAQACYRLAALVLTASFLPPIGAVSRVPVGATVGAKVGASL